MVPQLLHRLPSVPSSKGWAARTFPLSPSRWDSVHDTLSRATSLTRTLALTSPPSPGIPSSGITAAAGEKCVLTPSVQPHMYSAPRMRCKSFSRVRLFMTPWTIYGLWNSPGQNTGLGSLSLLQGIFPTQGLNQGLLHYRQILYQLSHKGSPTCTQSQGAHSPIGNDLFAIIWGMSPKS